VDLTSQLPWYHEAPRPRPADYCAPSCSQAATEGPIVTARQWSLAGAQPKTHITIEKAAVCLSSLDPFGQVTSGYLRIITRLLNPRQAEETKQLYLYSRFDLFRTVEIACFPDTTCDHASKLLYCMHVITGPHIHRGIVVKPTFNNSFERVGAYEVYGIAQEVFEFEERAFCCAKARRRDELRCVDAGLNSRGEEQVCDHYYLSISIQVREIRIEKTRLSKISSQTQDIREARESSWSY
jgi:hypothetical protein